MRALPTTDMSAKAQIIHPVMVRQAGEIIARLGIELHHIGGLVSAIRMGAVIVKTAAVNLAGRVEQVSGHGVGLPQVDT